MDVVLAAGQTPKAPRLLRRPVAAVIGGAQWELRLKREVNTLPCVAASVLAHSAAWQLKTQLRAAAPALDAEDGEDRGDGRTRTQEFL